MKNYTHKADLFTAAFTTDSVSLSVKAKTLVHGQPLAELVKLPAQLTPGADYEIIFDNGTAVADVITAAPGPLAIGGFHVGLDGNIVERSIWDCMFRPKAKDPRGMVLVGDFWVDIYLLGKNPTADGTSRAGVAVGNNITWWMAVEVLAEHGKQLLSMAEFYLAARGVEENKTAGTQPEKTGHIEGLKSFAGLEQATGCYWTWGREADSRNDRATILGGVWDSVAAGPRRWLFDHPEFDWGDIGARGRCDHLILG